MICNDNRLNIKYLPTSKDKSFSRIDERDRRGKGARVMCACFDTQGVQHGCKLETENLYT